MKIKNLLTVIIPFLNEGREVENTVKSIRDTAKFEVDILLINDNSKDDFDYQAIAEKYSTFYLKNEKRRGVAKSRDIGANFVQTKFLMFIDGHMRFYHDNWWNEIIEVLKKQENTLLCCNCKGIDSNGSLLVREDSFGAGLSILGKTYNRIIEPYWRHLDVYPDKNVYDIPCVLGASYAIAKDYWIHLRGLEGLKNYGGDEAYISLKVWLSGGSCKLLKHVNVEHIFRKRHPYQVKWLDSIFNKLWIAETIFSKEVKQDIEAELKREFPFQYFSAKQLLNREKSNISKLKEYYSSIFKMEFNDFLKLNTIWNDKYFKLRKAHLDKTTAYYASIFPDRRNKSDKVIKQAHSVLLRMLKIFNFICQKHKIQYWLDYGSLIGAVRHHGFIPWDGDVDIGIQRKDFNKLKQIVLKELPYDIFFQTSDTDSFYNSGQIEAKLRDKYSSYTTFIVNNPECKWHNGLQIDLFVYDIDKSNKQKLLNLYERKVDGGKIFLYVKEIEDIIWQKFEDTFFPIPKGYDSYLRRIYGDYMELPPINKRIPHEGEIDTFKPCDHPMALAWGETERL